MSLQLFSFKSFLFPFSVLFNAVSGNSLMPTKLGTLCKILPALVANKWFFSSVCSDMVIQSRSPSKSAGTVTTLEWFLTDMIDSMSTQVRWWGEALSAVAALVWFLWSFITDMHLEHDPLREGLLTLTAFPQAQLSDAGIYWLLSEKWNSAFIFTVVWRSSLTPDAAGRWKRRRRRKLWPFAVYTSWRKIEGRPHLTMFINSWFATAWFARRAWLAVRWGWTGGWRNRAGRRGWELIWCPRSLFWTCVVRFRQNSSWFLRRKVCPCRQETTSLIFPCRSLTMLSCKIRWK